MDTGEHQQQNVFSRFLKLQ